MTKKIEDMKKILWIAAIAILTLGAVSCTDWLYMPNETSVDGDFVFEDEAKAEMFVLGLYRDMVQEDPWRQMNMGDGTLHTNEDGFDSKYRIANYDFDPKGGPITLTGTFNQHYKKISGANIAIYRLGNMPQTDKVKALTGEALALRAYSYHTLIRIYGDVPAFWEPLENMDAADENTFYPKRTPRDETYDHIVADLQQAAADVPWLSESGYPTYERFSKQAVYALLARVALYAGGYSLRWNLETNDPATLAVKRRDDEARVRELYQIADDACRAIIQKGENDLVQAADGKDGFFNLWFSFCQRNYAATKPEILFAAANYGATTNSAFGQYLHTGTRGGVFGSRKSLHVMMPTYYLSFNPADKRRDVTCTSFTQCVTGTSPDIMVDAGTTLSSIQAGKFRHMWRVTPQNAANQLNLNVPILRYADVLLMYAETQLYLNGSATSAATGALQQVRDRAGVGAVPIASDFFTAIVQERKWETSGEMMLRTDLIRMGVLADEVAATQQAMKDLSDKTGAYASVAPVRLYKYKVDAQKYGDPLLAIDYVEISDAAQIALLTTPPDATQAAQADNVAAYTAVVRNILAAHGVTMGTDKWYPIRMFEAYNSGYNTASRKFVGFNSGAGTYQIGALVARQHVGKAENGGTYPKWIHMDDGSDGIFFKFQANKTELIPFANQAAGHPMIDNPNLTQHPGYL